MKALITGAAGFIGRNFRKYLLSEGWDVYSVDIRNLLPTASESDDGEQSDARDYFREANRSFDLVIHCAAIVGGRAVIDGAPLALASNLELDSALFQWALRTQPGRVVYFSSSAAYPLALQTATRHQALREDDMLQDGSWDIGRPDQLYGWSKLTGEILARRAIAEGIPVTVVRPFSGYGEDQDASYPFPAFIDRALRKDDPFVIWGNGHQVRDFIHVDDIVRSVMVMVREGIDGPVNQCSGVPVTMRGLAGRICNAAGYAPRWELVPDAPDGVAYRVGSASRFRQFYKPSVTLEEGIGRALEYRARFL